MTELATIGFIGVGLMGHGMAKNILAGGHPLWIKGNRNRQPIENLLAMGAQEAGSPRELAERCEIVHLCLSNSPQVEATVRSPDGILAGANPGLIVIDTTTADPASTMALAAEMAEQGVTLVDAPLGRTPKEAEAGTLDAMVGCPAEVFERIRPVIDCWAGSVTRIGETGSGHKMKLLMNFLGTGYAALYSEMLALGAKVDLPPQTIRDVLAGSRMGCGFFETFMAYAVGRDPEAHKFSIANASKDIGYVNRMALDAGTLNPMAAAIRLYFAQAEAAGKGSDYMPSLSDHVSEMNGIDLAAEVEKGAAKD